MLKFLEDHQKTIAVHQAKNISLNDDSRKEENDRYEEAIRGMKEKGVEIAVNEVDISDLLEKFDNVVDQELLKLDEEAKKLKLDESDRYKQLLDRKKKKILRKVTHLFHHLVQSGQCCSMYCHCYCHSYHQCWLALHSRLG